jgi:hypothetical protein
MSAQVQCTRKHSLPVWMGFVAFGAIAGFLLWEEHRAHFLGAAPYLLLLVCPIIHLFMHRSGHGGHDGVGASLKGEPAKKEHLQ